MNILKYFTSIFIFVLVLFLYVHILFHYKVGNELEIYEISDVCKDKLEEICDIRQPVIFDMIEDNISKTTSLSYISKTYDAFDVKIQDVLTEECQDSIPLNMNKAIVLFDGDKEGKYVSVDNEDFLSETGICKNIEYYDEIFRPIGLNKSYYDIIFGSENSFTRLKYDVYYRNYFIVTQGEVVVKLIPPKHKKYLQMYNNYETFEFTSPLNPWNIQDKYLASFNKIKSLEIILKANKCIFIPPFWSYSFKFNKQSSICSLKYTTYMNTISFSHHLFLYYLQNQNIHIQYIHSKIVDESL